MENSLNAEVFRLLREEVDTEHQDGFLRAVISHIRNTPNITVTDVRQFFYDIWIGAVAREKSDKERLGDDY